MDQNDLMKIYCISAMVTRSNKYRKRAKMRNPNMVSIEERGGSNKDNVSS